MKPFKFGDKIKQYWARYDLCPVCGKKAIFHCRRLKGGRKCKNGHEWHNDNGVVAVGSGHEKEAGITLPMLKAQVVKFVEQAELCGYECEGGPLENNQDFVDLKAMVTD